ncbi:trypsin-like peptidase domain-containing protein [Candidatus Babeliales bacterium]|nr:trypsin-like peptidase domain-containing protein [Candidatus Babeliales bacterium]
MKKVFISLLFLASVAAGAFCFFRNIENICDELAQVKVELAQSREDSCKLPMRSAALPSSIPSLTPSSRWIDVQKRGRNSVVQVFTNALAFNWFEPYKVPEQGTGCGSGFFIDEDGFFLTNYHVVSQALRVQVQMPIFGKERFDAEIVGVSPDRDLALLQLGSVGRARLRKEFGTIPFLKFGSSDDVQRGEEILALGFPLAMQHIKSTQGIVSGWERVVFGERGFGQLCFQMTAPINPGSSGGPSLNSKCEVVGINFAGIAGAQNVGYIIPVNDVKSAIADLHKVKLLRKPRLGCALQYTNEDMAKLLQFPEGGGLYVAKVMEGSLMERVGVKKGDVVREINGHLLDYQGNVSVSWNEDKVSGLDLLNRLVVGDEIKFIVYRAGKRKEFKFVFEKDVVQPIRFVYPDYENIDYEVFGGLVVMELSMNHVVLLSESVPSLLRYAMPEHGYDKKLLITHIQPTSNVYNMRGVLAIGSLLTEVNGIKVSTLKELRKELEKVVKKDFVQLSTEDDHFAVVSTRSILDDEQRLVGLFQYDKTHSVMLAEAVRNQETYA